MEQLSTTSGRIPEPNGSRYQMSNSLTPKEVFGILRRHILLIIFLTTLGLCTGGGTWYFLQKHFPRYTARTFIQVLSPVEKDPMTIGTIQLQKDVLYGYRQSIASLIKQQSTLEALIDKTSVQETKWFKRYAKYDENGRVLNNRQCMTKAYKYLKKHFGAYAHRDSEFVEISMTCGAAKEASDIVNEMLESFLATRSTTEQREISDRLQGLEAQRIRVQSEVDAANRGLNDIRETHGHFDLEMPTGRYFQHTITIRLNDLEIQKNELDLLIKQFQADIKNLQELAAGPITEQIEHVIESDPVMITLASQLALQEAQLSGRLSKFGENHRDVRQARELIDEIKQKRGNRKNEIANQTRLANLENAQDTLIVLQERYEQLEKLRQDAEAKKTELDKARIQYDKSMKIRDERIEALDAIKEQIEKLKIMHDDPETPKVLAVGRAPVPLEMVFSRQWWLWFPSGTVMGFLLSVGLAFLIELANDLVRTPSDVAKYLRIPLLGIIPDESEDNQVRDVELSQAVSQAPYSIISESYRRCRTNLKLSGSSVKTLLVSSGMIGDGTTSMSVNLAMTFVAENKKVLLIDANFRQPDLMELFQKDQTDKNKVERYDFGLSSVLMHQCASQEAIRPSGIEGLDIIDSGPLPANPAELLGNSMMARLIDEQSKGYDNIIIDGPPVLLVSDSKVLAGIADATILVFNASATSRGAAQRTIRELKEVDTKLIGCVLFAARAIKGGYFQEQFKSYKRYQKKAQKVRLASSNA